jgi:hypothetical protein
VALVELTERAEKSLLEILGKTKRLDQTLLVVDMGEGEGEAQLSVKTQDDFLDLQRDIEMIGPFRITLGSEKVAVFVRESERVTGGRYELDYYACGGRACFQIRAQEMLERVVD